MLLALLGGATFDSSALGSSLVQAATVADDKSGGKVDDKPAAEAEKQPAKAVKEIEKPAAKETEKPAAPVKLPTNSSPPSTEKPAAAKETQADPDTKKDVKTENKP